ncbi:MAG: hypothetical protein KF805_15210 [Phycisphaeraceae bacterium]|nr:hypothetical protein [Phycisphaeraceae bacterium]
MSSSRPQFARPCAIRRSLALVLACAASSAHAQVTINTTNQTITGDTDFLSSSFNGTPFRTYLDNGIAVFAIKGDLVIPANQIITITGSRPCRILVGNNLIVNNGAVFNASATLSTIPTPLPGPGAGAGGLGGQGGSAGTASFISPLGGSSTTGGNGGNKGTCNTFAGFSGASGQSGSSGQRGYDGNTGGLGSPGSYGGVGFGQSGLGAFYGLGGNGGFSGSGGTGGLGASPGSGGFGSMSFAGNGTSGNFGWPGNAGTAGTAGNVGIAGNNASAPTTTGSELLFIAGNGGAGAGGGGGGGGGGSGGGGGAGGAGGGGGGTSCNAGAKGGNGAAGGLGSLASNGGAGGQGGRGGGGGGALEITALGRLTVRGTLTAKGADAGPPGSGSAGGPTRFEGGGVGFGFSGSFGVAGSGNGGSGGNSGAGGNGGAGGAGAQGGSAGGGAGGTIRIVGTEFDLQASIDVRGGKNSSGTSSAPGGRLQVGAHTADAYSAGEVNGVVAIVDAPKDANPYFSGSPQTPYIANLQNGAAIAGIVPGLSATGMLAGLEIPQGAVGAIVFTIIDFPPLHYNTSNYTALLYLNISGAALHNPAMGAGAPNWSSSLKQYGWAKDARFGGLGPSVVSDLPRDAVYATLTSGPFNDLSNLSATAASNGTGAALEFNSIALNEVVFILLPQAPCAGDLNGDRLVEDSDFAIFASMYDLFDCAVMPPGCGADLNKDRFVDDADFVLFANAYDQFVCP